MSDPAPFDPSRYLTKVGNADYLEVKWRLVWLRERHPDAVLDTFLVDHDSDAAVFRAVVTLPTGGSATGYGSESMSDFRDYIEKAETKAIGRALAALGFGTQFCPDFDFESGSGSRLKVVDSPIEFASTRGRRLANSGSGERPYSSEQRGPNQGQGITSRQITFVERLAQEIGIADISFDLSETFGRLLLLHELSKQEASTYIERLQSMRNTTISS